MAARRALIWLAPLALACDGGGGGGGGGGLGGLFNDDTGPQPEKDGSIVLADENNYFYTGILDAVSTPAAQLIDVEFDWSGIGNDIQCHDMDPVADIDNVALMAFPYMTEEQVEDGMSTDSLLQSDVGVYLSFEPGGDTRGKLSDFTFFGTPADIQTEFAEDSGSWLIIMTSGTTVGVGARMLGFLEPRADSKTTEVAFGDGCSVLDFDADLSSLTPVPVLEEGPWEMSWAGLTVNGQASDMSLGKIDNMMLSRYEYSMEELEERFLDLEIIQSETWSMPLSGTYSMPLSELPGFDGFENYEGGTWLFALRCTTCPNPAPLFLTQLIPK